MTLDSAQLADLLSTASAPARALVETVLEQDRADVLWGEQVGPTLTQADTARLLGVSVQAVSKNRGLLRLTQRDGRVVYPVVQFDGRRALPGLAPVLATLAAAFRPLTAAGWLTLPRPELTDRTPAQALRDGDAAGVLDLARSVAQAAA